MKVPLLDIKEQNAALKHQIDEAIGEVVSSCQFIMGPIVKEFEDRVAAYLGCKHAVGCASGTDAILLSLHALGVTHGDEVVTTPFTFFATVGSIWRLGARPVFVDIDRKTYNIDPAGIEAAITEKTKAIIPVHLYGQCAEMDPIMDVARRHGLAVIEDAAQSMSAKYKDAAAGTIGDTGCLSFFPSKNLGGFGDGGMVVTNDDALAEKIRILRVHGSKPKYFHALVGMNSRLDSLQAAVLNVKLDHLDDWSAKRRENAARYDSLLKGTDLVTPHVIPGCFHIYNQYVIRTSRRDDLQAHLKSHEIGTALYYPLPLHLQECFRELGCKEGDLPESESASKEVIAIPVFPELGNERQDYVIETINGFLAS